MRRTQQLCLLAGLCAGMPAAAQSFTNGNFQTGTMSGWTVVNTTNGTGAPGTVVPIDIDGPGPLLSSLAARFAAGQAVSEPGVLRGLELTQILSLVAGTNYVVDFDWSVQRFSGTNVLDSGRFALIVNGTVIAQGSAGIVSPTAPRFGHVTGPFTPTVSGPTIVGVRIWRPFVPATDLFQYVDNVILSIAAPTSTSLGALPLGSTIETGTLAPNEVRWYTFTVPAVASPAYLDIDTEGSALAPINDTELGLYTATGTLVATDDDDGSFLLSQLTFGNTSPRPAVGNGLLYDGRDGTLAAGTYYLAVAGFNSGFGAANWSVASGSTYTGTFQLKLTMGNDVVTGACCSAAGVCSVGTQVACAAATGVYLGDGTTCATSACPEGACCAPSGTCSILGQAACTTIGGVFGGNGTTCATVNCPQPGACCIPALGCLILTSAQCTASGGTYGGDGSSCATANCPTVLFDSGRPCTITFSGSQTLVGLTSGSIPSQGFPNRWEAQAFTLPHASHVRAINVDGFVASGFEFATMNYIVWRRAGTNRPVEGDQVVTGSLPLPPVLPDPRIPGSPPRLYSLPVDFNLGAGDYYLTIHATDPITPGGDASFAWLTNAQLDPAHPGGPNTPIVVSDAQGVFFWRSSTMPSPGFERFTLSTLSIAATPAYGPNPQNPDYIYNTAFMLVGEVLPATCYPNCDGSTVAPILNVQDFACFLNRFAGGDSYANCDGSTTAPMLNVQDFACFLNGFAAGCS